MRKNEIAAVLKTIAENVEKLSVLVSSLEEEAEAVAVEKEASPEAPQEPVHEEPAMSVEEFRKKLWTLASSDGARKKNEIRDMALGYSQNEEMATISPDKYQEILRKAEEILHA